MKILICCATTWELKTVKSQIKSLNLKKKLEIEYLCTGIGNYETIFSLTKFLTENQKSDFESYFLLNIGICGYMSQQLPPSLIQVARIQNLATGKELLPPIPFVFAQIKSVFSSENVLKERNLTEEAGFVEMESRAIELVADRFRLPRLMLKVPYDKVGQETLNFDKQAALTLLAQNINYGDLIEQTLQWISKQ